MANLKTVGLSMNGAAIGKDGLKPLESFTSLTNLALNDTQVSDEAIDSLSKLTNLQYL